MKPALGFFCFALACTVIPTAAQRRPVLPQIDEPHPYYYRELYLPQLTSGPSSLSWAPDSKELVYSMAGSLWRQKVDSKQAMQMTDGGRLRLPARLVAGWKERGVRLLSERCDGIVAVDGGDGRNQATNTRRRGKRGTTLVARREKNCLGFHAIQQAIPYFCGGRD